MLKQFWQSQPQVQCLFFKELNKILHSSNFFLLITKDLCLSLQWLQQGVKKCLKFSYGLLIIFSCIQKFQNVKLYWNKIPYFIKIHSRCSLSVFKWGETKCFYFSCGCSIFLVPFAIWFKTHKSNGIDFSKEKIICYKKSLLKNVPSLSLKWLQQGVMTCSKFSCSYSISWMSIGMVQNFLPLYFKLFLGNTPYKNILSQWMYLVQKWFQQGVMTYSKFSCGC